MVKIGYYFTNKNAGQIQSFMRVCIRNDEIW